MKKQFHYHIAAFAEFIRARDRLPDWMKLFLALYSKEEYQEIRASTYLSSTQKSGYGIDQERNLISVFSLPGAKEGDSAVKDGIRRGACQLNCIGKKLSKYYREEHNFEEYRRDKWDDRQAPPGWDHKRWGKPDIIYMRLKK